MSENKCMCGADKHWVGSIRDGRMECPSCARFKSMRAPGGEIGFVDVRLRPGYIYKVTIGSDGHPVVHMVSDCDFYGD